MSPGGYAMWWTSRRAFLYSLGAGFSALLVPRGLWARVPFSGLDRVRMGALADAVLPSYLGEPGTTGMADRFLTWLGAYRPEAERSHGYGSGSMEIRYLPPDPTPRWEAQLDHLDTVARERFSSDFHELSREERQELVRQELAGESGAGISSPEQSSHVAAALMAFHFRSPEAWNQALGARVDKWRCRSLATVGEKPPPLDSGGMGR